MRFVITLSAVADIPLSQGIAELSDMVIERLQAFRKRSNVLPKRLFIFRDGVSELLITLLST